MSRPRQERWGSRLFPAIPTIAVLLIHSLSLVGCARGLEAQSPSGYLGETPPGRTPVPFAPHLITQELHSSPVFSPQLDAVFWEEMEGGIFGMVMAGGDWSPRTEAPFNIPYSGVPVFSVEGDALYFCSQHAYAGSQGEWDENVWKVERTDGGWSEPRPLGPSVNDHPMHWGISLSENGNLYFGHTGGSRDIFVAEFRDGAYQEPVRLGPGVNSDSRESTPHIAPDESYLVFSRDTAEGIDLFVSFREANGSWSDARSLDAVNTAERELSPRVSPDGEFLFFLRRQQGNLRPYWVSATVITDLDPGS